MQTNKVADNKHGKRIFFCWNAKDHKGTLSEYKWEQEYNRNEAIVCPICHQYHKVTMRMGDGDRHD